MKQLIYRSGVLLLGALLLLSSITQAETATWTSKQEIEHIDLGSGADDPEQVEGDDVIQNNHLEGQEMDSTDILAYSGQISDDEAAAQAAASPAAKSLASQASKNKTTALPAAEASSPGLHQGDPKIEEPHNGTTLQTEAANIDLPKAIAAETPAVNSTASASLATPVNSTTLAAPSNGTSSLAAKQAQAEKKLEESKRKNAELELKLKEQRAKMALQKLEATKKRIAELKKEKALLETKKNQSLVSKDKAFPTGMPSNLASPTTTSKKSGQQSVVQVASEPKKENKASITPSNVSSVSQAQKAAPPTPAPSNSAPTAAAASTQQVAHASLPAPSANSTSSAQATNKSSAAQVAPSTANNSSQKSQAQSTPAANSSKVQKLQESQAKSEETHKKADSLAEQIAAIKAKTAALKAKTAAKKKEIEALHNKSITLKAHKAEPVSPKQNASNLAKDASSSFNKSTAAIQTNSSIPQNTSTSSFSKNTSTKGMISLTTVKAEAPAKNSSSTKAQTLASANSSKVASKPNKTESVSAAKTVAKKLNTTASLAAKKQASKPPNHKAQSKKVYTKKVAKMSTHPKGKLLQKKAKAIKSSPKLSPQQSLIQKAVAATLKKKQELEAQQTIVGGLPAVDEIEVLKQSMAQAQTGEGITQNIEADVEQSLKEDADENARAAAEAAKDLYTDYGDGGEQEQQQLVAQNIEEEDKKRMVDSIGKQDSMTSIFRQQNLHQLAGSSSGLDSLIGASTALEMADEGDPEYLKKLSEKVALEADQSDEAQKQIDTRAEERLRREREKKEEDDGKLSVAKARQMAAKLNAQMQQGVLEAEQRKAQADRLLEQYKRKK